MRTQGALIVLLSLVVGCTADTPTPTPTPTPARVAVATHLPAAARTPAATRTATATTTTAPSQQPTVEDEVDRIVAGMSIEEKVGQLIISGFRGTEAQTEAASLVRELHLGGVVLLAANARRPAQVLRLTSDLQAEATRVPLLVAVDHEGGAIMRFGPPVTQLPDPWTIGHTGDANLARAAGEVAGEELLAMGINLNLAPVLDVNDEPRNPVIGRRSFGDDADDVARFATQYIAGLRATGVLSCGKHFPGHGHTTEDSHLTLPVVERDMATLERIELRPFRAAVEAGVDLMMTAHVLYPALDPRRPATLSPRILGDVLRGELGFRGPVITDALGMAAISDRMTAGEASVRALLAGADLLLVTDRAAALHRSLVRAVRTGRVTERRLDASVRRIVRLKLGHADRWRSPPDLSVVGSAAHQAVARRIREDASAP